MGKLYERAIANTAVLAAGNIPKDSEDFLTVQYGVRIFFDNAIKIAIFAAAVMFLGIGHYALVLALSFGLLRSASFGKHFETWIACTLAGLLQYVGGTYLAVHASISMPMLLALWLGGFAIVVLCAPVEHHSRPIPGNQRYKFKRRSILYSLLIVMASLCLAPLKQNAYAYLLLSGMLWQCFYLLPGLKTRICRKSGVENNREVRP